MVTREVGLLVGRERSFPDALVTEIHRLNEGVHCMYAEFEAPRSDRRVPYDVLLDRISHEVTCYQPWLKLAALRGTRVINNPFFRIADDKFFNAGLAQDLGLAVPKTLLLPQQRYAPDVIDATLERTMRFVDWDLIERELGYPMFMKPHWGGGWRDVSRIDSREQLFAAYEKSGERPMILQEGIEFTQYVRCIVVGDQVRPALWDPRLSHFERYVGAHDSMPPLSPALEAQCIDEARTISNALGYSMNTVELAVRDGVPYAIDYMNSAPDLDISSLGEQHFEWVVQGMSALLVRLAHTPATPRAAWAPLLHAGQH